MKLDFLLVGVGGFLRSMARYLVFLWFGYKNLVSFPWATLLVNVAGCLLIGLIGAQMERSTSYQHHHIFLVCSVGFLGAFTTFSAFGFETVTLLRGQQTALALLNIGSNVALGVGAVFIGRSLAALY